ncbi:MAG: trypsin-like peptidase domain-containing protein [Deltaproteobacteria bacterium]|nr:trypsin-like peptidase domain-containing protein [Deltaproteobacteria bacterium]
MTPHCPACDASWETADESLAPDALARCPFCRTIFDPRAPERFGGAGEIPPDDEPARDRWFVEVTTGVFGPVPLAGLMKWMGEERVDWEDLVSQDGGVWLPALEQRLLIEHVQAAAATREGRATTVAAATATADAPPVKIRLQDVTPRDVQRRVRAVAAGIMATSLLSLNAPGVVIGAGLLAMRSWARRAALVLLALLSLSALAGMTWAALEAAWAPLAGGMAAIGLSALAATVLMSRPVRASFRPGGGLHAAVGLSLAAILSTSLIIGAWRGISRWEEERLLQGAAYGYTLRRPNDDWHGLGAPRPIAGQPEADLELVRADGFARMIVLVEENTGSAEACLSESASRLKALGREPTVYQEQSVSAGGLIGAQEVVSVSLEDGRKSFLITCYVAGGQRYLLLGIAGDGVFDEVRSELTRLATSFRLEDDDDPLQLDIQTRPASVYVPEATEPGSLPAVVSRSERAVVMITAQLGDGKRAYGSGALIRPDGIVVTNLHVIEGAHKIMVSVPEHGSRRARILSQDRLSDLAILRTGGRDLPFLYVAAAPLRAGDDVIAIGAPMGLMHTVTKGIISSTRRMRNGVDFLQTDVSINPGNSGGPLLNLQGEVVGINTFIVRESEEVALTGLNFAVPSRYIRALIEEVSLSLPDASPARTALVQSSD